MLSMMALECYILQAPFKMMKFKVKIKIKNRKKEGMSSQTFSGLSSSTLAQRSFFKMILTKSLKPSQKKSFQVN